MRIAVTNLKLPVIISSLLVLPFVILELANRRSVAADFPIPLFGILWLLAVAFILILTPVVRKVRTGSRIMANPISVVLSVACLSVIAWLWIGLVLDQMPCFLGVPGCD